ncbi:hypothetical protein TcasGA2_TC010053 [Tribolium castaneum]|uniref:Uncharacterized protein n=1 Tax=Tribolium castaneum TaxID=7070 RepID=D6WRT0_TRICA|nr:hypothetical protein TcasGA2_TC010053 [Tribolium castaneum]
MTGVLVMVMAVAQCLFLTNCLILLVGMGYVKAGLSYRRMASGEDTSVDLRPQIQFGSGTAPAFFPGSRNIDSGMRQEVVGHTLTGLRHVVASSRAQQTDTPARDNFSFVSHTSDDIRELCWWIIGHGRDTLIL